MTVGFKAGSFQKSGTTTGFPFNESHITGLGFQPKAIMLFGTGTGTGTNAFTDRLRPSVGWTAGSTQNFSIGWGSDDNIIDSTNTFRRVRNDYCFCLGSGGTSSLPLIKLSTFDAGGATFTYDNNDTGSYHIFYLAVGGDDITQVKAGEFLPNTITGNQDVTDVGFEPDIVFFMGGNTPAPTTAASVPHLNLFFGVAKNSSQENVMALSSVDNTTPSDSARYQRIDRCIAFFENGVTSPLGAEAEYAGSISGGFRLNWIDAPADNEPIFYLAIKGGSWTVGSLTQPTTTGNQATTGLDYTPKGLFLYANQANANTTPIDHVKYAMGAADSSTSRWSVIGGDSDNVTTTETMRGHNAAAILRTATIAAAPSDSTDINSIADLVSFDTNTGFTLDWNPVDAVEREILYVTVGDSQGAALVQNVATETVNISEALNRRANRLRNLGTESVQISEQTLRALGRSRTLTTESLELSEAVNRTLAITAETITAESLQLRFSGGASNSVNTDSRGGAISSVSVTDDSINNTWDDVLFTESTAGRTEYRCYYVYNAHPTLTSYETQMWIDTTTPAGDSIEIGRGTSGISGTEQDLTASAETQAPTGVSFTSAPDADSSINLEDIPPQGHRAFWIKRIVPADTPSWNDNSYVLRVSFVSNHL